MKKDEQKMLLNIIKFGTFFELVAAKAKEMEERRKKVPSLLNDLFGKLIIRFRIPFFLHHCMPSRVGSKRTLNDGWRGHKCDQCLKLGTGNQSKAFKTGKSCPCWDLVCIIVGARHELILNYNIP